MFATLTPSFVGIGAAFGAKLAAAVFAASATCLVGVCTVLGTKLAVAVSATGHPTPER
ncbi:hypothetical protein [Microbacterium sp. YY-01]|uniref:hypothetical protein n=1 Tax=Microbacterium sp. YY-01 TaxID=3421634 RepID=UPI003D174512